MSKQDYKVDMSVSLNTDAVNSTHGWRDLTLAGLTIATAEGTIRAATSSMAEHYHELALQIERQCRKEKGTKFEAAGTAGTAECTSKSTDDQETIRLALAKFRQNVANELAFLKQEKGWEKDKLPAACDSAIRKIMKGWENNFSLEVLKTCSKIAAANKKREDEKDAELLGESTLTQQPANDPGNGVELTGNEEVDAVLLKYIEQIKAVAAGDSKTAISMVSAAVAKSANAAALHAAKLAAKVA